MKPEEILEKLIPYLEKAREEPMLGENVDLQGFSLEDKVGKTISDVSRIKNPLPYNPEWESPNPAYLDVEHYSDGSFLFHMDIGWHDGSTTHCFLVEGNNIRYSHDLYSRYIIDEERDTIES